MVEKIEYKPMWSQDGKTLSNVLLKDTNLFGTYNVTDKWWDGSPMSDPKLDSEVYVKYEGKYLVQNFEYGQVLQKDTMANMRALSAKEILLLRMGVYKHVQLNGYYVKEDTPAPINYVLSNTVLTDDGASVVDVNIIKVEHKFKGKLDVRYFGCKCDGIQDDSDYIQRAANYARENSIELVGSGIIRLTKSVNLRYIELNLFADVELDYDGVGLIVGGYYSAVYNPNQRINYVYRKLGNEFDSRDKPTIRIIGSMRHNISIIRANYVQLYADTDSGSFQANSCAYSNYYFNRVNIIDLWSNPNSDGSTVQWITENDFYLNNTKAVHMDGTYDHNHNKFHGGCFEGTNALINIVKGNSNYFYGLRVEGNLDVKFGELAQSNTVTQSFTYRNRGDYGKPFLVNNVTVSDLGRGNLVYKSDYPAYKEKLIAELTDNTKILRSGNSFSTRSVGIGTYPYREYVSSQLTQFACLINFDGNYFTRYAPIYESHKIPVKFKDLFRVDLIGSGRLIIQCYDEYDNLLLDNAAIWGQGLNWSDTYSQFHISVDGVQNSTDTPYGTLFFNVDKDTVKKVVISIARSTTVGYEKVKFKLFKMVKPYENEVDLQITKTKDYYLTGSPNQGFADVGDSIMSSDGLEFVCSKSTTYRSITSIPIGGNVVQILDTSSIQVGDIVALEMDNQVAMWSRVTGVAGGAVTILNTAQQIIPAGRRFFVSRYTQLKVGNATTTSSGLVRQMNLITDSTAADVAEISSKVNQILAELKNKGIMNNI